MRETLEALRGRAGARSQRGSALISAVGILFVTMSVAAVAAGAAILSQSGANRDRTVKSALAVADAGADAAIWRQNQILTTDLLPCLVENVAGELVPGPAEPDGWCAPIGDTVGEGSFSYRVRAPVTLEQENLLETRVVSTGTVGGETRRIMNVVQAPRGEPLFNGHGVISIDDLELEGNALIGTESEPTSAASDNSIVMEGNATICGEITHGVNGGVRAEGNAAQCPGFAAGPGSTTLAPVDQGSVATENDNGRFFGADLKTGSVSWSASTRVLSLQSNATLTLSGSNYSLCQLSMSGNSQLIVSAAAAVTLWFDSPEACDQSADATQMEVQGNARIVNTSSDPSRSRLYFLGSEALGTRISLQGNASTSQWLALHAPRTAIDMQGNTFYRGAVAGRAVSMQGNAQVIWADEVGGLREDLIPLYQRRRYVECLVKPGFERDEGC